MSKRKYLYLSCKLLFLVGLLLLAAAAFVFWWLQSGERDISRFGPSIIESIVPADHELAVTTGPITLFWESWRNPAAIRVDGVTITNRRTDASVAIAKAEVTLDLLESLIGDVAIHRLELFQPELQFVQEADSITLQNAQGGEIWQWKMQSSEASVPMAFADIPDLPVDEIDIQEAKLRWLNPELGDEAMRATASFYVQSGKRRIKSRMHVNAAFADYVFPLVGGVEYDRKDGRVNALLRLQDFNPQWLCKRLIDCEELPTLDVPFSGTIAYKTNEESNKNELLFALAGGNGTLAFLPHLPETLPLETVAVSGKILDEWTHILLEKLVLDFGETQIDATGEAMQEAEGFRLMLDASAANMPVEDLYKYWPQGLAPASRDWAITNITKGMAPAASARIRLIPDDLKQEFLPDGFLEANIDVIGANVAFIDKFPVATDVKAQVRFTGTTMKANIESAKALSATTMKDSSITLPDLNHPTTPVEIELNLDASIADTVRFLSDKPFNPLDASVMDLSSAKGRLTSSMTLGFDAFGDEDKPARDTIDWDAVAYDITGKWKEVTGARIKNTALSSLSGNFALTNQSQSLDITASMQDSSLKLGYQQKAKAPHQLTLQGTTSGEVLAGIIPKAANYITGVIGVDGSATWHADNSPAINLVLNLTRAAIALEELDYNKSKGEAASLELRTEEKNINRIGFRLASPGLTSNGALTLTRNQSLAALDIAQLKTEVQDFSANYQPDSVADTLTIRGNKLDLSHFYDPEEEQTISEFPAVNLNVDMAEIRFPTERVLQSVKGHIHCTEQRCASADLTANIDGKPAMKLLIHIHNGARRFSLTSAQAGPLLAVFDVTDKMKAGVLSVNGVYNDQQSGNPLSGRVQLIDFTLKDAPILGRILNVGSLTGLVETLSSKGISFDKLAADFVFANDLARLSEGKASGPSLGMMLKGDVNVHTHRIDIGGSLAPVYAINSLLGKIPLVGETLAGGQGAGLFALDFTVKGDMDDPAVTVNPLSALTPGFTRGFFDIFDSPPDTKATPKQVVPDKPAPPPVQDPPKSGNELPANPPFQMVPQSSIVPPSRGLPTDMPFERKPAPPKLDDKPVRNAEPAPVMDVITSEPEPAKPAESGQEKND